MSKLSAAKKATYNTKVGQVDVFQFLRLDADELVEQIKAGKHDEYMASLAHGEKVGLNRYGVVGVIAARIKQLEA